MAAQHYYNEPTCAQHSDGNLAVPNRLPEGFPDPLEGQRLRVEPHGEPGDPQFCARRRTFGLLGLLATVRVPLYQQS